MAMWVDYHKILKTRKRWSSNLSCSNFIVVG